MSEQNYPNEIRTMLVRDGFIKDRATIIPISGGISSDIFQVQEGENTFVVKRALKKLKVADDWFVDQSRNASEVKFLRCVHGFLPSAVPSIIFDSEIDGYFLMEFFGKGFDNWKKLLFDRVRKTEHARKAAQILAVIHRQTWDDSRVRARFETTETFVQLRLDSYLLTTGKRHPDLESYFVNEVERIKLNRHCLIHGDYSPKNLLFSSDRMVVLDCEAAWFGDPTFDVAFLLNHFFLKSLLFTTTSGDFFPMIDVFHETYRTELGKEKWEFVAPFLPRLLLLLMLARVDGKSPVEYLRDSEEKRTWLRQFTRERIPRPPSDMTALTKEWKDALPLS